MTTVSKKTITEHTVHHEGMDFCASFAPSDVCTPKVHKLQDGGWIVGYLAHDDDAFNPMEDCDGNGTLVDGRGDRQEFDKHAIYVADAKNSLLDISENFIVSQCN